MTEPGAVRRGLIESLWLGQDPLIGFAPATQPDLQGWNSEHPYLSRAMDRHRPEIVVEVGVWKGASVLTMARRMREIGCNGVVIAVDTWLGAADHWLNPDLKRQIPQTHGFPLLYFVFLGNVAAQSMDNYVVPLPLDSVNAYEVLRAKGIRPSVLHIDAGHTYLSVTADLELWWDLLLPGGTLIADDYDVTNRAWPDVCRAVDDFLVRTPHEAFEASLHKCWFRKPAGQGASVSG